LPNNQEFPRNVTLQLKEKKEENEEAEEDKRLKISEAVTIYATERSINPVSHPLSEAK
jgi:hypothetical protein